MQETLMALNAFNALDTYIHSENIYINMKKMPLLQSNIRTTELFQKLKDIHIIQVFVIIRKRICGWNRHLSDKPILTDCF